MEINKKYDIIYADPPWRYDRKQAKGAAENHYTTMKVEDICNAEICLLVTKGKLHRKSNRVHRWKKVMNRVR